MPYIAFLPVNVNNIPPSIIGDNIQYSLVVLWPYLNCKLLFPVLQGKNERLRMHPISKYYTFLLYNSSYYMAYSYTPQDLSYTWTQETRASQTAFQMHWRKNEGCQRILDQQFPSEQISRLETGKNNVGVKFVISKFRVFRHQKKLGRNYNFLPVYK